MAAVPRAAASVALVNEGQPARFLWARRTDDAPNMPGFHVLPGGLIEAGDVSLPNDGGGDLGARVAALRELFEETGILIANGAEALDDSVVGELRDQFLEGEGAAERFEALGLRFRTSELEPIGRWVTPEFAPTRADTRFFALRVGLPIEPSLDLREIDEAEWVSAPDAHARWAGGGVLLAPPIAALIRDLCGNGRLDGEALTGVYGAGGEPSQRWEVVPFVQLLPFVTPTLPPATHTNSCLIGSGEALLVEPATPHGPELERMLAWVDEARRGGIELVAIFATHHHIDHIGAIGELRRRLGLPLWAHRMTAQRLEGTAVVDRLIEHDEHITLRGPTQVVLRAIHTPGHAPGHLCLLEEASRALIAGDMVTSEGTIIVEPHDGDMALYLRSLREMIALEPSVILPAHGMPIQRPRELLEHTIAHRLEREAKVLAALRAHHGAAQPIELTPVAYDDTPKMVWPLAAMSLEAHLIKLEQDGAARQTAVGWVAVRTRS